MDMDRFKKRRLELGLTLEEVGKLVGVGKSTVRKWETGDIANMKRDKIALYAKALRKSPLWVMGIDETNNAKLQPDELDLLNNYSKLNEKGKQEAQKQVENLTYIPKYRKDYSVKETLPEFDELLAAHTDDPSADLSEDIEIFRREIEKRKRNKKH